MNILNGRSESTVGRNNKGRSFKKGAGLEVLIKEAV